MADSTAESPNNAPEHDTESSSEVSSDTEVAVERTSKKRKWTKTQKVLFVLLIIAIIAGVSAVLWFLAVTYQDEIIAGIEWINSFGIYAHIVFGLLCIPTNIPPLFGYGTIITICGFLFGWIGLITVVIGGNVGTIVGFWIVRKGACGCITRHVKKVKLFKTISMVVEKHCIKMIIFARLGPIPHSIVPGIFGYLRHVPFYHYVWAGGLSWLWDQVTGIYAGTLLRDLFELFETGQMNTIRLVLVIVQMVVLIVITVLITYYVKRMIKKVKKEEKEKEKEQEAELAEVERSIDAISDANQQASGSPV